MACFHPLRAYRRKGGYDPESKTWPLTFRKSDGWLDTAIDVPCGKCDGCRMDYAKSWAVRCMHEASLHEKNCVITLTYDDDHLPDGGELDKRGMQNWLKILRNNIGSFRYFGCGEYGKDGKRPHYHICIFGYDFPDKERITFGQSDSKMLRRIWSKGHVSVGDLTFQSAAYIARYCLKKLKGGDDLKLQKEYIMMSNRPGIGAGWLDQYSKDLGALGRVQMRDGSWYTVPPYYAKRLSAVDPVSAGAVQTIKSEFLKKQGIITGVELRVREQILQERLKQKQRSFEYD